MTDETALIGDLLDEVYALRRALAYEASVVAAHLTLKSFPKSRREFAENQIERMRLAACGGSALAYAGTSSLSLRSAFKEAGASESLTRSNWRWADGR